MADRVYVVTLFKCNIYDSDSSTKLYFPVKAPDPQTAYGLIVNYYRAAFAEDAKIFVIVQDKKLADPPRYTFEEAVWRSFRCLVSKEVKYRFTMKLQNGCRVANVCVHARHLLEAKHKLFYALKNQDYGKSSLNDDSFCGITQQQLRVWDGHVYLPVQSHKEAVQKGFIEAVYQPEDVQMWSMCTI